MYDKRFLPEISLSNVQTGYRVSASTLRNNVLWLWSRLYFGIWFKMSIKTGVMYRTTLFRSSRYPPDRWNQERFDWLEGLWIHQAHITLFWFRQLNPEYIKSVGQKSRFSKHIPRKCFQEYRTWFLKFHQRKLDILKV